MRTHHVLAASGASLLFGFALTGQDEVVPLSGDFVQVPGFNANGIVATPD